MLKFKQYLIENLLDFKSPQEAYYYAENKDKRERVPEVEEFLLKSQNTYYCLYYAKNIIKDRWPEYEEFLLKYKKNTALLLYTLDIIKGRWPEFEKILLQEENVTHIIDYVYNIIKGRWTEAEEIICTSFKSTLPYCKGFNLKVKDFQEELIQKNNFNIVKIDHLHPDLVKKYYHLLVNKDTGIL